MRWPMALWLSQSQDFSTDVQSRVNIEDLPGLAIRESWTTCEIGQLATDVPLICALSLQANKIIGDASFRLTLTYRSHPV